MRDRAALFIALMTVSGYAGITFIVLAVNEGKPVSAVIGAGLLVLAVLTIPWMNRRSASGSEKVASIAPALPAFAAANGWGYSESSAEPAYGGSLFAPGFDRTALEHLWSPGRPRFGLGSYRYSEPGGDTDDVEYWGFVAVELERPLPHLVLVAGRAGYLAGGLPFGIADGQALSLGAELDRVYTLHGPAGFEHAASALFTPRLLDLLTDEMGPMHSEVVDGWFYAYSFRDFRGAPAGYYERLLAIVDTAWAATSVAAPKFAGAPATRLRPAKSARARWFRVWNWSIPISVVALVAIPVLAFLVVDRL